MPSGNSSGARSERTGSPMYGFRPQAIVVLENASYPYVGGNLILGQPDELALQVLSTVDPTVGPDVDSRVTKEPGYECRNAHVGVCAARNHQRVTADRYLRYVKFLR